MKQSKPKPQTDDRRRTEIESNLDNLEWITLDDLDIVMGGTAGAAEQAVM